MYTNTLIDNLSRSLYKSTSQVSVSDITVCIAIRASKINPWVLPRLEFALQFYNPKPNFLIVDFGSDSEYAQKVEEICRSNDDSNVKYLYVDDKETFSLSKARNIAGRSVDTDFIFFTDVDFVFESNIFGRLAKLATDLELKTAVRRFLPMPIYHVSKQASEEFELQENKDKDRFINTLSYLGHETAFRTIFDFVAPYSNAFLISKSFFSLSGGYCDEFRGHGSEDFEYLIRLGLFSSNAPLPNLLNKDFYGPLKDSFFGHRDYSGFRRYAEVLTVPSESLGLKAFHIWHPSPKDEGYWTKENDWKRDKFNTILDRYYPKIHNVIDVDFLPRDKKALCIYSDEKSWGYFIPLRLAGYQLISFSSKEDSEILNILNRVERKEFDRIFIFNPYMKSHVKYRSIIEIARRLGIEVTVIERGGLPNSLYYASEVAYGDIDYKKLDDLLNGKYKVKSKELTKNLISFIKTGKEVLENQENYETTWNNNILLRNNTLKKVFIPLQLPDDMAVTQFTDGYTKFSSFYEEINELASSQDNVLFIVKQHPLMKQKLNSKFNNLIIANDNANIHALIDICDATIVYNSGVGLLSCLHMKPTFNIGNAYYSANTYLSNQVTSIREALDKLHNSDYHVSTEAQITIFLDWLINTKYSWFTATDVIREFETRKSHGYSDIMVEILNVDGIIYHSGSRVSSFPFNTKSYLGWKLALNITNNEKKDTPKPAASAPKPAASAPKPAASAPKPAAASAPKPAAASAPKPAVDHKPAVSTPKVEESVLPMALEYADRHPNLTKLFSVFLAEKKAKKLQEDPKKFFEDSKNKYVKMIGKLY